MRRILSDDKGLYWYDNRGSYGHLAEDDAKATVKVVGEGDAVVFCLLGYQYLSMWYEFIKPGRHYGWYYPLMMETFTKAMKEFADDHA